MNEKELLRLIEKGESQKVEFKENFDKETIETAVAFANTNGGTILIGVNDKGEIKGASVGKETLKGWINKISQATEPALIPEIESYDIERKTAVEITIKESPIKPIAYKGVCYIRVKNSNRKLSSKEIAEFHLQTTGSSWDSYLARDADLDDIDLKKVEDYIKLANETGRKKIKEKPLDVLRKLELIKDNRPTWAAILLFGKEPQRFVSQAKIHCGRFKDETTIIDDELIEDNIIEQVDKTLEFIKRHLKLKFEITGKPRREEIWEYPLDALRESVINAICHRDYTESSDIQIRIYDDKLIVWSSGKLPLGITLEELYKPHKSVLRNKLIAQVFFDTAFIERWGSGIHRIIKSCLKQGLPEPKFEEYQGFRVIFRKDIYTEEYLKNLDLNERQVKAVMFVKKEGKITNKKYQELFDVSERSASRELNNLVKKSVLRKIGITGKGTYYELMMPKAPQRRHKGAKHLTNASKGLIK